LNEAIMRRRFFTLDVFTSRRFTGNPLAVVLESEGLDTAAMQTVAREFNLPETVFVFPPSDPKHRAKLRIFTPARELPFAGHPTVGTAVLMAHLDGASQPLEVVLGEEIGPVACTVTPGPQGGSATFGIPKLPEKTGPAQNVATMAAVLNLAASDIGFEPFAPEYWSAGNAFAFVPVRSLEAMARARPDLSAWKDVFPDDGPNGAYLFCGDVVDRSASFHTRMFAPKMGLIEDPATGSAAATFAGVLAASGRYGDGEHAVILEQGVEMGRPSLIRLTLTMRGGRLAAATVGGDAVLVSEGTIEA
jgi:trans-2,3-dihydro-3-hydroxyanthranilate isomerase